eukprot:1603677-Rhodomonas_salina.1
MLERMVKGQGLLLVLVLSVFGSVSGSCFDDPTASACGDVAVYYNIVEDSLKPICSALPWVTGCAVYRQCEGEQVIQSFVLSHPPPMSYFQRGCLPNESSRAGPDGVMTLPGRRAVLQTMEHHGVHLCVSSLTFLPRPSALYLPP